MSKRVTFLSSFLGALGAQQLAIADEGEYRIVGTVIFDPEDPEEQQDFHWCIPESGVPDDQVFQLAALLHEEFLLDIDTITLPMEELHAKYCAQFDSALAPDAFLEVAKKLLEIEVPMLDEGKESDRFFIRT